MKAPEKIFLQVCGDCYASKEDCRKCKFHEVEDSVTWSKERIHDDDIEYTRTDAFIEKAKSWFDEIENGTTIIDKEAFFNAFKNYIEHDDSDLDIVLSDLGVEPDSSFANSLIDAVYKADALNEIRKKARRAALNANIDKLWVAGDTIYLKDADPEKAEAFILSLAEYGYDTQELFKEYKQTGKIAI